MATIKKTFLGPGIIKLRAYGSDGTLTAEPVNCGRGALVEVDVTDPVLARVPERFGEPGCLDDAGRSASDGLREQLDALSAKLTSEQARSARLESYLLDRGIDPETGEIVVAASAEAAPDWQGLTVVRKRALAAQLGIQGMSAANTAALDEAIGAQSDADIAAALELME